MAIKPSEIEFRTLQRSTLKSGLLNNLFPDGKVNGATDYQFLVIVNTSTLTLTSPKAWLTVDTKGATLALAVADGVARNSANYAYPSIDPAALTYSTPTSQSSGLALPTLPAGQECLIAVRRTLTSATTAYPESNRINIAGTSPL